MARRPESGTDSSSLMRDTRVRGLDQARDGQEKADRSNIDSEELQIQGLVFKYYSSQNSDNKMKCESEGSPREI